MGAIHGKLQLRILDHNYYNDVIVLYLRAFLFQK